MVCMTIMLILNVSHKLIQTFSSFAKRSPSSPESLEMFKIPRLFNNPDILTQNPQQLCFP